MQSVKNTDTHKGYDEKGEYRDRADTRATADVTDRAGAFDRRRDGLSQVQNVRTRHCGARPRVKRNELHTFVVLPKRWVVERSFAWLEKCRRLWTKESSIPACKWWCLPSR